MKTTPEIDNFFWEFAVQKVFAISILKSQIFKKLKKIVNFRFIFLHFGTFFEFSFKFCSKTAFPTSKTIFRAKMIENNKKVAKKLKMKL